MYTANSISIVRADVALRTIARELEGIGLPSDQAQRFRGMLAVAAEGLDELRENLGLPNFDGNAAPATPERPLIREGSGNVIKFPARQQR